MLNIADLAQGKMNFASNFFGIRLFVSVGVFSFVPWVLALLGEEPFCDPLLDPKPLEPLSPPFELEPAWPLMEPCPFPLEPDNTGLCGAPYDPVLEEPELGWPPIETP